MNTAGFGRAELQSHASNQLRNSLRLSRVVWDVGRRRRACEPGPGQLAGPSPGKPKRRVEVLVPFAISHRGRHGQADLVVGGPRRMPGLLLPRSSARERRSQRRHQATPRAHCAIQPRTRQYLSQAAFVFSPRAASAHSRADFTASGGIVCDVEPRGDEVLRRVQSAPKLQGRCLRQERAQGSARAPALCKGAQGYLRVREDHNSALLPRSGQFFQEAAAHACLQDVDVGGSSESPTAALQPSIA